MNYDEFLDIAAETARKLFPDTDVTLRQVDKLQGESYKGLNVRIKDGNAGLSMNLSKAFEMFQKGENSLAEILNGVMDAVRNALQNMPQFDPEDLSDYRRTWCTTK